MAFKYWLPDEVGDKQEYCTESNAVIIIGANGSGKSKLGAWMEQQDLSNIHRIGGQRNLNFKENLLLMRYSQAIDKVFYGYNSDGPYKLGKGQRWGWGNDIRFTTTLIDDFDDVLAALFALRDNENEAFIRKLKEAKREKRELPPEPVTVIDKLKTVWESVLPTRQIVDEDHKFYALFNNNGYQEKYSATQMSDGERAVLYLSAQVLCIPYGKTIIIDEPELHLHRSIMNPLWTILEKVRPDCLFIYITHDTQFAAFHENADKIWVKKYNGEVWEYEKLNDMDLPEELLLYILGTRKSIIFVEGERNSYDTQLYAELYPDYQIIPCGSCTQVIERTKAFRNSRLLHDYEVYGIIDRDYRSEHEIEKYKQDSIYAIGVAEVENLFIVEELIRFMAGHMGKDKDITFSSVKKYVTNKRYLPQINKQICEGTVAEIKYLLTRADISNKNDNEAQNTLDMVWTGIDYQRIREGQERKFRNVLVNESYRDLIKVFNHKSVASSVGHLLGINDKEYCQTVIALLHGKNRNGIIDALSPYLPEEISRD